MGLVSMTGFGAAEVIGRGVKFEVEISSVNRKQFDLRLHLPRSMSLMEAQVYEEIQRVVKRGQITANVKMMLLSPDKRFEGVDKAMAGMYVKALREAASELDIKGELDVSDLIQLPDVIRRVEMHQDARLLWPVLQRALRAALKRLVAMRKDEGARLEGDLRARLDRLKRVHARIEKRAPQLPRKYRTRLQQRLKEALGKPVHDEHLIREVALLADRVDITEEVVRMGSHFKQFDAMLGARKPIGRALDFLCQELLREINTSGSKASDEVIARAVIQFKADLECIREQVQNVE